MVKQQLKPGDIVIYKHTLNGETSRNGSLGIVTAMKDSVGDYVIDWLLTRGPVVRSPYSYNLEKVGHLDDF